MENTNNRYHRVREGMMLNILKLFAIPAILSLVIMLICFPGFMSYDSIRMLEEARTYVRGGIYPPGPVYILRFFDLTGYGVPVMVFIQNFTILACVALLLKFLNAGIKSIIISSLIFLSMSTVIGGMLVLWKDITLTSLMFLSLILIFWGKSKIGCQYFFSKWVSLALIAMATLVRLNAISGTLVIVIYWIVTFFDYQSVPKKILAFFVTAGLVIGLNIGITNYRLPSFEKLEENNISLAVMAFDLVGISNWSRTSLIPFDTDQGGSQVKAELTQIDAIYSSIGVEVMKVNIQTKASLVKVFPVSYSPTDVVVAWISGIIRHPIAYIQYRWDLFSEIIGATNHQTYEPTHFNRIDDNTFGIRFQERIIADISLTYIEFTSNVFFGKPWFCFFIGFCALVLTWRNRFVAKQMQIFSLVSFATAFMYVLPFFIISGTGEVRYSFPAVVLSFNSIVIWVFSWKNRILLKPTEEVTS